MLDQLKFMETLRSVAEVAKATAGVLTRAEINKYFEDCDLSVEQQEMVYQYLLNPEEEQPEQPEQSEEPSDETADPLEAVGAKQEEESDSLGGSLYLQMYLEEINDLAKFTNDEARQMYMQLLDGEASVTQNIADHWLVKVVEIAKTYSKYKVNMEDLIQEGNIGLLSGLGDLLGSQKVIDVEEYLTESVKKSMEDFIDESLDEDDWETTMLAKVTLIHEAQKSLQEELGRIPSATELCNYTKLSEEEVADILKLSNEMKDQK